MGSVHSSQQRQKLKGSFKAAQGIKAAVVNSGPTNHNNSNGMSYANGTAPIASTTTDQAPVSQTPHNTQSQLQNPVGVSAGNSRLKPDAFGSIDELHKYRLNSRNNSPRTNRPVKGEVPKPNLLPPQVETVHAPSLSPPTPPLTPINVSDVPMSINNNKRMRSLPEHRVRIKSAGMDIVIKEFHLGIDPGPIQVDETSGSIFKFKTPYFRGKAILEIPPLDVAETWIFGWIQACYDLKFVNTYGKFGYSQWMIPGLNGSLERAVSDSDGKRFPWYGLCTELFVVEGPTYKTISETVSMSDNFYPCVTWDIPTDKYESAKLTKVSRDQKFYIWLVGMNATKRQIYVLKGAKWGMKVTVKLDPQRPLGSRTKSVSGRLEPPVILDKDRRIPDNAMIPPSANSCQKLIWKARGKREKIVIPAKRQMHHNERKLKEQTKSQQSEVTRRMKNIIMGSGDSDKGNGGTGLIKRGPNRTSLKAFSIDNSHLADSIPIPSSPSQQVPTSAITPSKDNLSITPQSTSTTPNLNSDIAPPLNNINLLEWRKNKDNDSDDSAGRRSISSLTNPVNTTERDSNRGGVSTKSSAESLGNVSGKQAKPGRRLSRILMRSLLDLDGLPVEHLREVDESETDGGKNIPLPRCASNARSYSCEIEEEYLETLPSDEDLFQQRAGNKPFKVGEEPEENVNNTSNNGNANITHNLNNCFR